MKTKTHSHTQTKPYTWCFKVLLSTLSDGSIGMFLFFPYIIIWESQSDKTETDKYFWIFLDPVRNLDSEELAEPVRHTAPLDQQQRF